MTVDYLPGGNRVLCQFRDGSFCADGTCVEVGELSDGTYFVRDTKDRSKSPHVFTTGEWAAFVAGVKGLQFDLRGGEVMWKEIGRTVRAAIEGTDRTVRLCILIAVATAAGCVLANYLG